MTAPTVERRRITLLGEAGGVDLVIPVDDRLGDALQRVGLHTNVRSARIVDRRGATIDPATPGGELDDGGLYAVVESDAARPTPARAPRTAAHRAEHGARWILLGIAPVLGVVLIALVDSTSAARVATGAVFGTAAVATALVWAARAGRPGAAPPIAMAAPVGLAAVAAAVLVPGDLVAAVQLRIAIALLAAAVLALLLAVGVTASAQRAAWGAVATLLLGFAAVQGVALLLRMPLDAAAIVSLGIVPLALRALPTTLVNVPEGLFIDYRHFMSTRWSVRGAIPDSPATIAASEAERVVQASTGRLTAGSLVLSLVAVAAAALGATRIGAGEPMPTIGSFAVFGCAVLALLLTPRHTTGHAARWMPRAAAIAVLLAAVAGSGIGAVSGGLVGVLGGVAVFAAAVLAAIASLPIARGARSLAWSRVGDVVEWLAVALALPAGLLAADTVELLRGMMAA
ncbi:hypothetical protein [Agromyces larvae]|uniref:Type VII secretion integral membrane protein EccD n=1 Tax=Agromyces larvae TaxID=2929802 RepID=A0ABY4C0K3_9MICO|nr:hypothetical protein [Agromyces larvae]UOE43952.1 hypothetical protein MTO99_17605 [Agromyces larvae]